MKIKGTSSLSVESYKALNNLNSEFTKDFFRLSVTNRL